VHRQLLANGDFKAGLRGWWGRNAVLHSARPSRTVHATRIVVRRRTSHAGIATWPRIASRDVAGSIVTAGAAFRARRAGGPVCIRVREYAGRRLASTKVHCTRAAGTWKQIQVRYRLRARGGALGVVVYRVNPRRGLAFEVKRVSLRARSLSSARSARSESPAFALGISANSQGWGSSAGVVQDRVAHLGLHWLREDFVRAPGGKLDSGRWDAVFAAAAARGLTILPVFTNTSDYEDTSFVAAAVARYGPGGSFWSEHSGLDASHAPTWWEVGNEPWMQGQTPGSYAKDFRAAVTAGRAANGAARFLLATFSTWKNPSSGQWESWVTPMFSAAPDLARYVDGWSNHPYCNGDAPTRWDPSAPNWVWEFLQFTKVHAELADHGLGDAPMWLTEFGYSTAGDRSVSEQQQADYLVQAAHLLPDYPYARALFLYQLQDWGPRDGDREHYFGISRADGSPKPAWAAVAQLAAS
jgi:hypothetical protein